jgi:predicted nucleic acid-binding protein
MKRARRMHETSEVVLDANVLVRLVAPGEYERQAEALWTRVPVDGEPCVVPAFCPTEVLSSLRQMGRGGFLTWEEEEEAVDRFTGRIQPVLITIDSSWLSRAGWEIARGLNERHAYDSVYLAVARALRMEFWTADRQLLRHLGDRFPGARFLGDYPLPPPAP